VAANHVEKIARNPLQMQALRNYLTHFVQKKLAIARTLKHSRHIANAQREGNQNRKGNK